MSEISQIDNEMIAQLQLAKQRFEEDNLTSSPKIQRIHSVLRRNANFVEHCTPMVISFGPIHHGVKNLEQGEHYKLQWTALYIEEYSKQTNQVAGDQVAQSLLKTIKDNIGELKKLFTDDAIGRETTDEDLAWMLFVDGCSLLYFMENFDQQHPEALKLKLVQLMYIWKDIILLENQLPRRLLELLISKNGAHLEYLMMNCISRGYRKRLEQSTSKFHSMGEVKEFEEVKVSLESKPKSKPNHVLDYVRTFFTSASHDHVEDHISEETLNFVTYKNIRDLKAAGIRVKASTTGVFDWSSVSCSSASFASKPFHGELRLPIFMFNNISPYFFRNMVAYEMCPDFDNNLECCVYLWFMNSLIESGEDVKELRLAGVIVNNLGTDEELAEVFKDMIRDLPTSGRFISGTAHGKKYVKVRNQIDKHYKNAWKTIISRSAHNCKVYFKGPWFALAFLATLAALALTAVQTYYSIHPKTP